MYLCFSLPQEIKHYVHFLLTFVKTFSRRAYEVYRHEYTHTLIFSIRQRYSFLQFLIFLFIYLFSIPVHLFNRPRGVEPIKHNTKLVYFIL